MKKVVAVGKQVDGTSFGGLIEFRNINGNAIAGDWFEAGWVLQNCISGPVMVLRGSRSGFSQSKT
jgi:hypothetical protein